LKLAELIDKASEFGKTAVFELAKVNRRSNRNNDRKLMARSIPVFEALVDTNLRKDRHYYFGQLGYALKDQEKSDWKKAEENFNIAIDIRGPNKPEYFYEFNRALCKVYNDSKGSISNPSDTKFQDVIVQDLSYAKKGIGNQFEDIILELDNRILMKWLKVNNINLKDL